jgi:hypothetical protein
MLAVDVVDILAATGFVVVALATAVIGVVVAKSSEWVQWRRGSDEHTIELRIPPELRRYSWNVLHIRDGSDETTHELSEREKWFARLRNEIRPLREASGDPAARTATLRFYRPLGLQFKCFLDVESPAAAESARQLLETSGYRELDVTDERQVGGRTFVRVWFLHPDTKDTGPARYRVANRSDGKRNSFFYPV